MTHSNINTQEVEKWNDLVSFKLKYFKKDEDKLVASITEGKESVAEAIIYMDETGTLKVVVSAQSNTPHRVGLVEILLSEARCVLSDYERRVRYDKE